MNISRYGVVGIIVMGIFSVGARAAGVAPPAGTVTMLVPGFVVRELPIDLTNLTSLEYAADGKLWALGYDGRVHVLSDTDGDGLEDTAKTWWQPKDAKAFRGPIGMKVTQDGVYVASKGKISLLKDTNGDGVGDTEEIIATGWKEAFTAVDATGLALDKEGNVYFGLGCADFSNAYQLDKEKKPHYDINSTQGTMQRLSADHKKLETLATGVRFAIGIAFNRHGDLFWTDQEGDTWTKGNHLDELNVLLPDKRHYGFPERHPEYLPNTDDEPPVVGFGPQHQSTCGLKFNEAREGWKTFGPKLWENDALVAGESRGKIWRVPLVKVREGYVGRSPVAIAYTGMLTVDLAVSPKGEMVICCHSGAPDWGTGPTGKGRLFKISYVDERAPQPVIAWPAGKDEIRVAFDRAIDASVEQRMSGLTVSCGEFVRAADRLEVMRPPYVVVRAQMQTPRRELKIASAKLSEDGRTLSVKLAEAMPWRSWYAVAVPGVKAAGAVGLGTTVDLDFHLGGAQAKWESADHKETWEGWVPHFDPQVIATLTNGSSQHESLLRAMRTAGHLTLQTELAMAGDSASVTFASDGPFEAFAGPFSATAAKQPEDEHRSTVKVNLRGAPQVIGVSLATKEGAALPRLEVTHVTDLSATPRPISVEGLGGVDLARDRQTVVTTPTPPELTQGGDWLAGKALFFGEAKCAACHTVRGEGGAIGPNLSHLTNLNPESVLQDIVEPSARINPDYINYIVTTTANDSVSGLVKQEGEELVVMEGVDKVTRLKRDEVKEIRPSKISLMPEGFKELGEKKLRDLLTFLTGEAPKGAK